MKNPCNDFFDLNGVLASHVKSFEFRSQQLSMAQEVYDAIKKEKKLIIEAGTGTGKTLAYLVPVLLNKKKAIISTGSKNLQEQLKNKDLPLLKEIIPHEYSVTVMKGRNNYLCLRRFIDFRDNHSGSFFESDSLKHIFAWGQETITGDRADFGENLSQEVWKEVDSRSDLCLGRKCTYFNDCFVTKLRIQAQQSDLIIINHYLFFADVQLRSNSDNSLLPKVDTIIFDEAHMLEEIATEYFGYTISRSSFIDLMNELVRELKETPKLETKVNESLTHISLLTGDLFTLFQEDAKNGRIRLYKKDITEEMQSISEKISWQIEILSNEVMNSTDSEALKRISERFITRGKALDFILNFPEDSFVAWKENKEHFVSLHASPIDISSSMKEDVFPLAKSMVFTSATLSSGKQDFNFLKGSLGFADDDTFVQLDTPFDYKKSVLYHFPQSLPEPSSSDFINAISEEIHDTILAAGGRTMVLFTSYKALNGVYKNIRERIPYKIYRQMSGVENKTIMSWFTQEKNSVLFGTSSFWQGVDVVGDSLSCLIIDKLPFASPGDPILSARIDHINLNKGNPFMEYQVPMAVIALKQGFGRLIRHKEDRGVFVLLDNRVFTKRYGKKFLDALPETNHAKNSQEIAAFFSQT
ncbi:MAG: ATP-dependent DNA helicase [Nitrospinae bacterium]|nr:ATP-dependent DNA helicase [Nitrospinota bacterium]